MDTKQLDIQIKDVLVHITRLQGKIEESFSSDSPLLKWLIIAYDAVKMALKEQAWLDYTIRFPALKDDIDTDTSGDE